MTRLPLIILAVLLPSTLSGCAAITPIFEAKPTVTAHSGFDSGDAGLNTALLERRLGIQSYRHQVFKGAETGFNAPMNFRVTPSETSAPQLRGLMPRASYENPQRVTGVYRDHGVQVYRPAPKVRSRVFQPEPAPVLEASSDEDISYVKMGGGSNMSDWQACETLAGGLFVTNSEGFTVAADFDRCMRARGYITEREAQSQLSANPRL